MNCPFCNAILPALTAPPAVEKLPCPRCGELVPAPRWEFSTAVAAGLPPDPPLREAGPDGVPGKRNTAFLVLGVMLTMAVIGLGYMLWTVKLRQSRHPKPALDPVVFTRPLDLKGLGYLPKDSDLIVGLHIAEWLDDKKVGKPLLDEPRPAALDWIVKQLPRITGLKLEEIDHAVLSASLDARFPQASVVIRTRRAYDLGKIAEHAKPADPPLLQDRALYELSLNPAGEALLWCVEDKTLLCAIRLDVPKTQHMNGFSVPPRKAEEVLPTALHTAIKERLPKRNFAWAIGRLDRLDALKELPIFPLIKPKLAPVQDMKTFALGLAPDDGLTLLGNFHLTDAKSAAKFKTTLEGVKIDGAKSQTVVVPPPETPEQWVTWQVRGDAAAMRAWLSIGKDVKK